MTGPKLNEANRVAGTKSGVKSSARFVRMSASKARVVLNLIRDVDVKRADEILQFTDREAARVVRKVLASAVANAVNDEKTQFDADDLYVKACFADEGPTLKRMRPRARGRAGHINKRTCHITVVVDQMSDDMMAKRDAKSSARGSALSTRRARVEASRKRSGGEKAAESTEPTIESTDAATTEATSEETGN
ncbi:MAG: 50S ribosomal protein L22 [Actinobacteria bacterium]|nr:50S ribosomal protein L22 [Actinomycetota bacterium]